jgi:hypothetical protein
MSRSILIAKEALVAAPVAALFASAPAAVRMAGENFAFATAWLAVAGLLGVPLVLAIALARLARRSLVELFPGSGLSLLVGVVIWALVAVPADAALGAMLKATTHHRALGGATFAVLAVVINLVAALVAWRFAAVVLPRVRRYRRGDSVAIGLAVGTGVLLLAVMAAASLGAGGRSEGEPAQSMRMMLLDGGLAMAAVAVAAVTDLPAKRATLVAWLGGGALLALLIVGGTLLGRSPGLAREVAEQAPLAASMVETMDF